MCVFDKIFFDEHFDQLNNMVRWNGLNRIKDETVAHHSFIVTWFSRILAEEIFAEDCVTEKLRIITYATFQDFDEMFTGDINHNLKYNKFNGGQIRAAIHDFIDLASINLFPSESPTVKLFRDNLAMKYKYVKLIVKIADWLSMSFYLKKEMDLGNRILLEKYKYCTKNLWEACDEAADYLSEIDNGKVRSLEILTEIKSMNWKYEMYE